MKYKQYVKLKMSYILRLFSNILPINMIINKLIKIATFTHQNLINLIINQNTRKLYLLSSLYCLFKNSILK